MAVIAVVIRPADAASRGRCECGWWRWCGVSRLGGDEGDHPLGPILPTALRNPAGGHVMSCVSACRPFVQYAMPPCLGINQFPLLWGDIFSRWRMIDGDSVRGYGVSSRACVNFVLCFFFLVFFYEQILKIAARECQASSSSLESCCLLACLQHRVTDGGGHLPVRTGMATDRVRVCVCACARVRGPRPRQAARQIT